MKARMLLLILGVGAIPLEAQRTWLDPMPRSAVALVTALGVFDDNLTESPAATMAFRGSRTLAGGLTLNIEVPVAHVRMLSGLSGTSVGNPWAGMEFDPGSAMQLEVGARLNLWPPSDQSGALAQAYGQLLDFDRREAWLSGSWAVRAMAHFGRVPGTGPFVTTRIGLVGMVAGGGGGDGELLAHYGGRVGVASPKWLGWLGIVGQGLVTESGELADRTQHQAEVAVATRGVRWQVALSVRRYVAETFGSSVPLIGQLALVAAI
jgi:hypothetical protein